MLCPCGCGEELTTNVDRSAGKAWSLYRDKSGITIYPSIWRDSGCESHFIISRGLIFLFSNRRAFANGDEGELERYSSPAQNLSQRVEAVLTKEYRDIETIADAVEELPWDVLVVCRGLARADHAKEGTGKFAGHFRLP
jgi:hypothetical protein